MGAWVAGLSALALVLVAGLVAVSSAAPDAAPGSVVLEPHGAPPLIYNGPGDRAQLNGLWRFKRDPNDTGLDKGYPNGDFSGDLVRVPYVPSATRISGRRGINTFRGTIGWYRTKIQVPTDGLYTIRFESVNHKAEVFVDGDLVRTHTGEYLPFDVQTFLKAGEQHTLVVRADWRGPTAMKRDGWHRLWFNFGGINRNVSIRRIGASELSYPVLQTKLDGNSAQVSVNVHVRNHTDPRAITVKGTLSNGDRQIPLAFAPEPVAKNGTEVVSAAATIDNPALWSPSSPTLWDHELEVPGEST
jgi:beta-galactosidase/beta-glucuronidase